MHAIGTKEDVEIALIEVVVETKGVLSEEKLCLCREDIQTVTITADEEMMELLLKITYTWG